MDQESLRKLAKAIPQLTAKSGPQTDDELHAWVEEHIGVDIPRTKVCPDHNAPFDFLSDLYFNRTNSAVLMANRGGAKTFLVAILHLVNSKYKPGLESATVGAIEKQAERAYSHLRKFVYDSDGRPDPDIMQSKMKETEFRNGAKVEIIAGTMSGVNGPHPQVVHIDEVELMDAPIYDESRNMSKSKKWKNIVFPAQDIITSTRKTGKGMMQSLIDDIEDSERNGKEPPYKLYKWCLFETTENQAHWCQCKNPELPEEERCPCDKVYGRAVDERGGRRTLKDVCQGRFARSGGFSPLTDVINTFTKSAPSVWDAQQECSKPSTEGMYIPNFQRERNGIKNFEPDPENGPIYMSYDPGGTNPHAVNWYQILDHQVDVTDYFGKRKRLVDETMVCFDEIYVAEIGNNKVFDMIVAHELQWRLKFPKFEVAARFVDPQAKAARMDMANHIPPLYPSWHTTREFDEHLKDVRQFVDEGRFAVDVDRCEMFVEEIESWRMNPLTGKQIDVFNHCMSNWRYAAANIKVLLRLEDRRSSVPMAIDRHTKLTPATGLGLPVAYRDRRNPDQERPPELWRAGLGQPITYR